MGASLNHFFLLLCRNGIFYLKIPVHQPSQKMQYLSSFHVLPLIFYSIDFFSPTNFLIRNSKPSGREHIDKISVPLQASRHHCFPFPTSSLFVPTATSGTAHVWTQDPGGRSPAPPPRSTLAASGTGSPRGRRPGYQGNGKTPSSRPHRLRPEKGRGPRRTAASGRSRKRGRKWEGRREAWGRKRSPGPAPRTIDGRFLCCGPAHPLRPAAPLAPGKG